LGRDSGHRGGTDDSQGARAAITRQNLYRQAWVFAALLQVGYANGFPVPNQEITKPQPSGITLR